MHVNLFLSPACNEKGEWRGWGRCVFFVDDVDALHASLVQQGVEAPAPKNAPWGERSPRFSPSVVHTRVQVRVCLYARGDLMSVPLHVSLRFFHVLDPDGHELSFATPDYTHPRWQRAP